MQFGQKTKLLYKLKPNEEVEPKPILQLQEPAQPAQGCEQHARDYYATHKSKMTGCNSHMPGAAIVMRDKTTCDMPFTAAYYHNNTLFLWLTNMY